MDNFYLHEKIKNENLKAQQKARTNETLTNILLILCFPVVFIFFLIIGLGTKKEK